ncbi:MAG: GNAT family N-acetyltransferase [Bacteroidales bacterium]|nr:GNAT family N-acetyltransferase [Bacteroidales bacterium]
MILLKEITTPSVFYAEAENLLIEAFPPEERRPLEQQRQYTDHNTQFQAQVIICDFDFAGILNTWNLGDVTYVEHLAIKKELRGLGLASQALSKLKLRGKPIILEVEPATDETTRKRIQFYEKNGFRSEPVIYEQPSYGEGLPAIAMRIMTCGTISDLNGTIRKLKKTVYGVDE